MLTEKLLQALGMNDDAIVVFTTEWPDGCELTKANILRAAALGLDLDWARHFLPPRAEKTYSETTAKAWGTRSEKRAEAKKVFDATMARARKSLHESTADAKGTYHATMVDPEKSYNTSIVQAVIVAFSLD